MGTDEYVGRGDRHVLADLVFDAKVRLRCRSVLKVLGHRQHERQHRPKSRERLIVKALTSELVLGR